MVLRLIVVSLCLYLPSILLGQGIPCESLKASTTCEDAPIICDLNCLDGFTATMPDPLASSAINTICFDPSSGNGIGPSNTSWFAFVAGDTVIEFEVTPFNCVNNSPGNPGLGVQGALLGGCETDRDSNILEELVLDCYYPTTNSVDPFTITSNDLVVGQVYYFVIDGYFFTKCQYTINVIQGKQPFELDDIDSLVLRDTSIVDTMCLGVRNVKLRPNTDRLDIQYYWKVDPPLGTYTNTFVDYGYETNWSFTNPGTYEISVYADNGCDKTDTLKQTVHVRPEPAEIFDTVDICYNKFPYEGPLSEDPNGDGLIGWQGPPIQYNGGTVTHTVTRPDGCSFDQIVTVNEIMRQQRVNVSVMSCGPINYHGNIINQTSLGLDITIPDANRFGCDSLVLLDAYVIDLRGRIQVQNCDSSGLSIELVIDNISAPAGYSTNVRWYDSNGPLVDDDNDSYDIYIFKRESYRAEVEVISGTDTCIISIDPVVIDPDDNRPQLTAIDWDLNLCDLAKQGTYSIQSDQPTKKITWSIPGGATILDYNADSTTINVDFGSLNSGTVSVEVENYCSGKSLLSLPISIITSPVADFILPDSTCKEDPIVIAYRGNEDPSFSYRWRLPQGGILITGNLNDNAPLQVALNGNAGPQPITLIVSNNNCVDSITKVIQRLPEIPELNVSCTSLANSVTFTWDEAACADTFLIYRGGQLLQKSTDNTYSLANLTTNEDVDIRIDFVGDCPCSTPSTFASCKTKDCQGVNVEIDQLGGAFCEDQWQDNVPLSYTITGADVAMGTISWNDTNISNDTFYTTQAGVGIHTLILSFEESGCIFNDTIKYELLENPTSNVSAIDPACIDETAGFVTLQASGGSGTYNYILDGQPTSQNELIAGIGPHNVVIIDGNSCQTLDSFTINPPPSIAYNVSGETDIYESEVMSLMLNYNVENQSLIDSIVWYVNGEIVCSGLNCLNYLLNNPDPGTYNHQIVIYYNEICQLSEILEVRVRETSKLYIPNAFKIGSDIAPYWYIGTNDPNLEISQLMIIDRWGNKILFKERFNPAAETQLWDGSFNGKLVDSGVYIISLNYTDEFGIFQTRNTHITVVR